MRYRSSLVALLVGLFCLLGPISAPRLLVPQAHAQTVSRIVVEGTQRIEPETVTSYMHIAPGDPFDAERIDDSLKTLFQNGLFSDGWICRRGNFLAVRVDYNPMIKGVNLADRSEYNDKDLEKET